MHPELLERAGDLESGRALLDDEQVVALVSALAIGLGDDERPMAAGAAGDEDLAAVDDEMVAVAFGGGCDARHIGAGVRLRDRQGCDVLAADGGDQPFPLLLLGSELQDRRRRHLALDVYRPAYAGHAGPRHLL